MWDKDLHQQRQQSGAGRTSNYLDVKPDDGYEAAQSRNPDYQAHYDGQATGRYEQPAKGPVYDAGGFREDGGNEYAEYGQGRRYERPQTGRGRAPTYATPDGYAMPMVGGRGRRQQQQEGGRYEEPVRGETYEEPEFIDSEYRELPAGAVSFWG